MAVTINDVEYVAKLARLEFNEQQKERFTHDLNNILKYVEQLNEVDTEDTDISINAYPMSNALREDKIEPSLDKNLVLENAPSAGYGYFKVPKVIE